MSKSHVSMEQKQCMVCGTIYDSGAILFDTRIRYGKLMESMETKTITGYGLCEEHQKLFDNDYIALVEANHKNTFKASLKASEADRTGNICHLRRAVADDIMNATLPKDMPMVFVEVGVIDKIKAMMEEPE